MERMLDCTEREKRENEGKKGKEKRGEHWESEERRKNREWKRGQEKKLKLVGHDVGSILSLSLFSSSFLLSVFPLHSLPSRLKLPFFPFPLLCPSPRFPFFLFSFAILWNKNKSRVNQTSPDAGFGKEREREREACLTHHTSFSSRSPFSAIMRRKIRQKVVCYVKRMRRGGEQHGGGGLMKVVEGREILSQRKNVEKERVKIREREMEGEGSLMSISPDPRVIPSSMAF